MRGDVGDSKWKSSVPMAPNQRMFMDQTYYIYHGTDTLYHQNIELSMG